MKLGERIKNARLEKGWTQKELAKEVGVTAQAVSGWEGDKNLPDLATCRRLYEMLGIPAEAFLGLESKKRVDTSAIVLHDRMFSEEHMYTFVKGAASSLSLANTLDALPFMKQAHEGQVRKNNRADGEQIPYIYHPLMIACHALAMGLKDDTLIAAILLHDVVEDCPITVEELPVDDAVKAVVAAVTKDEAAKAHDPAALQAYYANIAQNDCASMVKVLDRCNNIACMATGFQLQRMVGYIEEAETYILPLLDNIKDKVPAYHDAAFLIKYQMLSTIETVKRLL